MNLLVKSGELRTLEVINRTVRGVLLKAYCVSSAVNVDNSATPMDLSKVNFSAKIVGRGNDIKIAQDKLQPLAMFSAFTEASFLDAKIGTAPTVLLAHGAAAKGTYMMVVKVDFGGPINLKGNEKLIVDIEVVAGAFASGIDTSVSYIQADEIETYGLEILTPSIVSKSVANGESANSYSFGDHVNDICFINIDKTDVLAASQVIASYSLVAKKLNVSENAVALHAKRYSLFKNKTDADARCMSFMIGNYETALDDVRFDVQFNQSNVASGKNFVLCRKWLAFPGVIERGIKKAEDHENENVSRLLRHRGRK
jgi:hypothetical protein